MRKYVFISSELSARLPVKMRVCVCVCVLSPLGMCACVRSCVYVCTCDDALLSMHVFSSSLSLSFILWLEVWRLLVSSSSQWTGWKSLFLSRPSRSHPDTHTVRVTLMSRQKPKATCLSSLSDWIIIFPKLFVFLNCWHQYDFYLVIKYIS